MIFVFGSNSSGAHAGGAAAFAHKRYGAVWGIGEGLQGESYALPTMGYPEETIAAVKRFLVFATLHPELDFKVTRIGCGIAGGKDSDIAPLFSDAPANCHFDTAWREYLPSTFKFWGTF